MRCRAARSFRRWTAGCSTPPSSTTRRRIACSVKDKVKFYKTPDSVLQKQLDAYDAAASKKSAENPIFKEIADSQKAFAERAVKWDLDTNVSRRMAYNHYFGQKPAPAKKA